MTGAPAEDSMDQPWPTIASAGARISNLDGNERCLSEAPVKCAIPAFAWRPGETYPDHRNETADQYDLMAGLVREHDDDK